MKKSWRIIDILNWGSDYFDNKNISESRLNIELILSHILNYDRINLYLNYEKPLNDSELSQIKDLVKRKISREPIQYIVGKTQFLKYSIGVNPSVLIPRPETELLVDLIFRKIFKKENLKILEIGTGSGCISIALGDYFKDAEILSIDYSSDALKVAESNSINNNVKNIKFHKMDILNNIPNEKFDLIVSNPPYISEKEFVTCEPEVQYFEPKSALSDYGDGLSFYRRFNNIFEELLNDDGMFFLEIAYNQKIELENIFQSLYNIDIYNDFSNLPRYLFGKKIKKL